MRVIQNGAPVIVPVSRPKSIEPLNSSTSQMLGWEGIVRLLMSLEKVFVMAKCPATRTIPASANRQKSITPIVVILILRPPGF